MGDYTTRRGLYRPGGGSSNSHGPDEAADIDKINDSFTLLDAISGAPVLSSTSLYPNPLPGDRVIVANQEYRNDGTAWRIVPSARTLLITSRVGGGTLARGSWQDIAWDASSYTDYAGMLAANKIDITLPWDGVYEIEQKFASSDISGGRLLQKWRVPAIAYDGPWEGVSVNSINVLTLYRDTFVSTAGTVIRGSVFVDGSGGATIPTDPGYLPRLSLKFIGAL